MKPLALIALLLISMLGIALHASEIESILPADTLANGSFPVWGQLDDEMDQCTASVASNSGPSSCIAQTPEDASEYAFSCFTPGSGALFSVSVSCTDSEGQARPPAETTDLQTP